MRKHLRNRVPASVWLQRFRIGVINNLTESNAVLVGISRFNVEVPPVAIIRNLFCGQHFVRVTEIMSRRD